MTNFIELEYINPKTNEKQLKTYSQNIIDKLHMLLNKGFKIDFSERIIPFNPMDIDLKEILNSNLLNTYNLIFYDYDKNTFITPNEINCYLQRLNERYNNYMKQIGL